MNHYVCGMLRLGGGSMVPIVTISRIRFCLQHLNYCSIGPNGEISPPNGAISHICPPVIVFVEKNS